MVDSTSPQIRDEYAPLDVLSLRALRRYGEMAVSTIDGDTALLFMDYGNTILDEIMAHPYWKSGVVLPYFKHQTEVRPIPDSLLLAGLLSKYANDQDSTKARRYEGEFYRSMNQTLARVRFGVSPTFEMQVIDYGTNTNDAADPGVVV